MVCTADQFALSPAEAALFIAYTQVDYDLSALIASQSLTAEQAIDFVTSPAVQAALGELCKVSDRSDHLFNSDHRRGAVKALTLVIEKQSAPAGDPVELRKAATNLLRHTDSPERSSSASSTSRSGRASSGSSSSDPRSEIPDPKWPDPKWQDPRSIDSQSDIPHPTSPTRPARLDSSPDSILHALADSASRLDSSETASILKATLSPEATTDDQPITDDTLRDRQSAVYQLTHAVGHVQLSSDFSNTRASCAIAAVDGGGCSTPIYVDFERINLTSASERWRITAVRGPRHAESSHRGSNDTS